ncbi:MAG: dTMP kinase [Acidimicrobiia bacterium]
MSIGEHLFIALEGCDGAGKTSIRDVLCAGLQRAGRPCLVVGQHSWLSPPAARIIVDVRRGSHHHSPEVVADAYFQDKVAHVRSTIGPALTRASVIADRYIVSDAVYQEVLYGIPAARTLTRHWQSGTLLPDLVVFVELDTSTAYGRILKRGKATRHYERPAPLRRIDAVYHRVLFDAPPVALPPVVRFVNDKSEWRARVEMELLPRILGFFSGGVAAAVASR